MTYKKPIHLAALALATAAALPAAADHSPWYGALSAGSAKTDHEFVTNRESTLNIATNINSSFDDKDSAWKATLGYRISQLISIELNYADYGSIRSETRFTVPDGATRVGGVDMNRDVKGFGVDALISAPFWDRFTVWGRVGAFRAKTDATATISGDTFFTDGTPGNTRSNSSTDTVAKLGVGLDWNITPHIAARLEYERLDKVGKKFQTGVSNTTGEAAIDTIMLGAVVRF